MGRVIILEGPDGGGKTTLAQQLVKHGFKYVHEGPPAADADLIAHYLGKLYFSLKSKDNVVHDRLWLGERMYGPVSRNIDRVGMEGQILFNRIHQSKSVFQYVCMPALAVAKENYKLKIKEKDDYLKSMSRWEDVVKAYQNYVSMYGVYGTLYDYANDSVDRIVNEVMSFKNNLLNLPEGTIGYPTAKYLFIGSKPNHPSIDVPFFALTGSSGYFNKALKMADIIESDLAISNARDHNSQKHLLGSILARLPRLKHIFLMGGEARDWFNSQSDLRDTYKISDIPHPSYLKRFRGHNPRVMADIILEELYG